MEEKYNESEALLTVKDLKMHFPFAEGGLFSRKKGAIRAVDGISFSVKKGETLGLVGESGCGKSTAARAIAQLYTPTSGSIRFKGMELAGCSHHTLMQARKDMQMVFQDPYASLNPRMTAGNIIAEPMRILTKRGILSYTKKEIDDRVEVLMEKVGLSRFFRNRTPQRDRAFHPF